MQTFKLNGVFRLNARLPTADVQLAGAGTEATRGEQTAKRSLRFRRGLLGPAAVSSEPVVLAAAAKKLAGLGAKPDSALSMLPRRSFSIHFRLSLPQTE